MTNEELRALAEAATTRPAPNEPGCTCLWRDEEDDADDDELILCPMHERRIRPLRWETLAGMVIDFMAASTRDAPIAAEVPRLLDRVTALENALRRIAYYDGPLTAIEAARSWRIASAALSQEAATTQEEAGA